MKIVDERKQLVMAFGRHKRLDGRYLQQLEEHKINLRQRGKTIANVPVRPYYNDIELLYALSRSQPQLPLIAARWMNCPCKNDYIYILTSLSEEWHSNLYDERLLGPRADAPIRPQPLESNADDAGFANCLSIRNLESIQSYRTQM
jgi:hypothetical protein